MFPLLRKGDELIAYEVSGDRKIGDVLLFKDPVNSEFVVHRVIKINPLVTKGDWSCQVEEIPMENVFALVVGFIRGTSKYSFKVSSFFLVFYLYFSRSLTSNYKILRVFSRMVMLILSPFLIKKKNDL